MDLITASSENTNQNSLSSLDSTRKNPFKYTKKNVPSRRKTTNFNTTETNDALYGGVTDFYTSDANRTPSRNLSDYNATDMYTTDMYTSGANRRPSKNASNLNTSNLYTSSANRRPSRNMYTSAENTEFLNTDFYTSDANVRPPRNTDFNTSTMNNNMGFSGGSNYLYSDMTSEYDPYTNLNLSNPINYQTSQYGGSFDDDMAPANLIYSDALTDKLNNVIQSTKKMMYGGNTEITSDYVPANTTDIKSNTSPVIHNKTKRLHKKGNTRSQKHKNDNDKTSVTGISSNTESSISFKQDNGPLNKNKNSNSKNDNNKKNNKKHDKTQYGGGDSDLFTTAEI